MCGWTKPGATNLCQFPSIQRGLRDKRNEDLDQGTEGLKHIQCVSQPDGNVQSTAPGLCWRWRPPRPSAPAFHNTEHLSPIQVTQNDFSKLRSPTTMLCSTSFPLSTSAADTERFFSPHFRLCFQAWGCTG